MSFGHPPLPGGYSRLHGHAAGVVHAVKEGFLTEPHRATIMVESDPKQLLERMRAYSAPEGAPLMGRTNR